MKMTRRDTLGVGRERLDAWQILQAARANKIKGKIQVDTKRFDLGSWNGSVRAANVSTCCEEVQMIDLIECSMK